MGVNWYVLRSKPNKEKFFFDQLLSRGVEAFLPCVPVRTVNPRARKVRPYFPGYLFVQIDLEKNNQALLRWMPGSAGFVCFDDTPASVPEGLINAIRHRVEEINQAGGEQLDGLRPGEEIRIQGGPFSGFDAVFDSRLSGNERVRVLIKFLRGRQLPVELPTGLVQKKKQNV